MAESGASNNGKNDKNDKKEKIDNVVHAVDGAEQTGSLGDENQVVEGIIDQDPTPPLSTMKSDEDLNGQLASVGNDGGDANTGMVDANADTNVNANVNVGEQLAPNFPNGDGAYSVPFEGQQERNPRRMAGLSSKFMSCLSGLSCRQCGSNNDDLFELMTDGRADADTGAAATPSAAAGAGATTSTTMAAMMAPVDDDEDMDPSDMYNLQALQQQHRRRRQEQANRQHLQQQSRGSHISPLVSIPMMNSNISSASSPLPPAKMEQILAEYTAACAIYGCRDRINAGIMATIRFGMPCLRVTGAFHDADMLALVEVLLKHCNTSLRFIHRLDFGVASREGRLHRKKGFTSHGALALSKVLQTSQHIRQVYLPRHKIGPFGASALFLACSTNATIQVLCLRRCRIRERGALVLAELMASPDKLKGLTEVDLSANGVGYRGKLAIEHALNMRMAGTLANGGDNAAVVASIINVDLEGNLVFPEIMNGCTHGLGVLLSFLGGILMANRANPISRTHTVTCAIYSTSLIVLYTSSTLYHSFFSMQATKYIFEAMDKCAIYILIAGSYTPFLQIMLNDIPMYANYFLVFLWLLCILGIGVETFCPTWQHRGRFSLAMYLGMGWLALFCLPQLMGRLQPGGINLLILGGVGYTAGVPFFVRNNNLDHAIWHIFVLSGSIFHWLALYIYVVPNPLPDYPFDSIDGTANITRVEQIEL